MKEWGWIILAGMLSVSMTEAARPAVLPAVPEPVASRLPEAGGQPAAAKPQVPLMWHDNIDTAVMISSTEYRPVLVLFSMPDCAWCERLKAEMAADRETIELLRSFVLVEVDITRQERTAAIYQIRGVPVVLILSADGRPQTGVNGYVPVTQLRNMLTQALNPEFVKKANASFLEMLQWLDEEKVPDGKWPDVMLALGQESQRKEIHQRIFEFQPFPKKEIAALLKDSRLAVRLGALEILEELTGTAWDFDPWLDPATEEKNTEALTRWAAWAGETGTNAPALYSALTEDQITAYIHDLGSENRERMLRARRMLQQGGPAVASLLEKFMAANPDLVVGMKKRIKEVQYAVSIPAGIGADPADLAQKLVFGTLDVRRRAIARLPAAGRGAIPILREFLEDPDAMVRETAVDALVMAGGRSVVPMLEEHLKKEKDADIIHTILRNLGGIRSRHAVRILNSYLQHENEDLAIVALESLGRLKSFTGNVEIGQSLEDPRWRVRVMALETVAKLKLTGLQEKVEKRLRDEDIFVRSTAVKAVAAVSDKKIAGTLETLFFEDDNLKAPVVEAFLRLELRLLAKFKDPLARCDPDTTMAVIHAMEDCRPDDLDLVADLTGSDNLDVACAAVRLIAAKGMSTPRYQSLISQVLRTGRRELALAALESMNIESKVMERYSMLFMDWLPAAVAGVPIPSPKPELNEALEKLFAAFTGEATPPAAVAVPSAPTPAPAAPANPPPGETLDDLFSSFAEKPAADAGQTGTSTAKESFPELIEALESRMQSGGDSEIVFRAALILAGLGNPKTVPFLDAALSQRLETERTAIAEATTRLSHEKVLPLLQKLIQDPAENVRKEAVDSCFAEGRSPAFVELVFENLLEKDSRLKPLDMYGYQVERILREGAARQKIRGYCHRLLTENSDPALQSLGLILLEKCWQSSDESLLDPFAASENPWHRRAALYTLGKAAQARLKERIKRVAEDPSENVRTVIPAVYMRGQSKWIHFLDETHFTESPYGWYSSSYGSPPRLASDVRDILLRLAEDKSAKVRIEAFFCLLSNRESVDLARFVEILNLLPDRTAAARRVAAYLTSNYQQLGENFKVLIPYLENSGEDDATMEKIRRHFKMDPEQEDYEAVTYLNRAGGQKPIPASFLEVPAPGALTSSVYRLVYFTSAGCRDCEQTKKWLDELQKIFPTLQVETHDIRTIKSMRFNEALCERFSVPEGLRLVTPAIFSGGGYLIRKDVSFVHLGELLSRSAGIPDTDWYSIREEELAQAEKLIGNRYSAMGLGVVMLAGLLDGINPCAFAVIIFLLSYLQITRRNPREIIHVGIAFIAGVFLAYFGLGLGLVEIISRLEFLRSFTRILNLVIAGFALLIMALNIRDGILCLRGRLKDISLQLPGFLKAGIHTAIRRGMRHAHFVAGSFIVGAVISFLELACTGQVYAPTILFMLKTGQKGLGATGYLALYNLAFIAPLVVIFLLAYGGMRSEALIKFLERRAALVKFCTAALFLILFLFFLFGGQWTSLFGAFSNAG